MICSIKRGVERAGASVLVYHDWVNERCSEAEVKDWLKRRKSGNTKECLIMDPDVSRGWEASHVLVVALHGAGMENLVMRSVGYCALVRGT